MSSSSTNYVSCPFLIPGGDTTGIKCEALDIILDEMKGIIVYQRDLNTEKYDYLSPSCQEIMGLTTDELDNLTIKVIFERFIHPEDQPRLQEAVAFLPGSKLENIKIAYRLKCRDGNYRWFEEKFSILLDKRGVASKIIGFAQDIDDVVKLRNELKLSEMRLKSVYDNASMPVFRCRMDGERLIECNGLFAWTMGYSSPEQCLASFSLAKNAVIPKEFAAIYSDLHNSKAVTNREIRFRRNDGSTCWTRITVYWCDQEFFGGSLTDITGVKSLSETEMQVLKLVLAGLSNKEIAGRMERSRRTIEQHRASIMKKLNAQNLLDLARHYTFSVL